MPFQCDGSKAAVGAGYSRRDSNADEQPRRIDDGLQPVGELQLARRLGCGPGKRVEFVVQDWLARDPAGCERHHDVMPLAGLGGEHLAPARQTDDPDRQPGFLRHLTLQGAGQGLAEFDAPTGQ